MERGRKSYRIMTRQTVTRIYEVSAINDDQAMNAALAENTPKSLHTGDEELISIDAGQSKTAKRNEKIIDAVLSGQTRTSVAKNHGISISLVTRIVKKSDRAQTALEAGK